MINNRCGLNTQYDRSKIVPDDDIVKSFEFNFHYKIFFVERRNALDIFGELVNRPHSPNSAYIIIFVVILFQAYTLRAIIM